MSPIETSAIIFFCVFGSAMFGMWLHDVLPEHHLNNDSKDVVKLGVGLIGTMTALLLGLLVASAKSSYDARSSELNQVAANTILLDRLLAHYGTETGEIRGMLKFGVAQWIDQVWSAGPEGGAWNSQTRREIIFDKIQGLTPRTDVQRTLQSQAISIAISVGQTRWLLFEQGGSSISATFLVVVVFWLSILFISFGLFAPRNGTVIVTLLVSAMAVAGAIFLVLELDRPFSGLVQISSAPLRNALALLGR
jgi:hypothetical protein